MRKPELLSPAGDWEKLRMAVLYGADAVYLAGTSFGMRSFAGNFSDEELPRAVRFAHEHGASDRPEDFGALAGMFLGQPLQGAVRPVDIEKY